MLASCPLFPKVLLLDKKLADISIVVFRNDFYSSHGYYGDGDITNGQDGAYFAIGTDKINSGNLKGYKSDLRKFREVLNSSSTVTFLACHMGAKHNGGEKLSLSMAQIFNTTVYSNTSWGMASSKMFNFNEGWLVRKMFGNEVGEKDRFYQADLSGTGPLEKKIAVQNIGHWKMSKPPIAGKNSKGISPAVAQMHRCSRLGFSPSDDYFVRPLAGK